MDDFERYLANLDRHNPYLSALVEAVTEGYKICHSVSPNGISGDNHHDSLLLNSVNGILTGSYHNILTEGPSVNTLPEKKDMVLHNIADIMSNYENDETIRKYIERLKTSDMTQSCDALYSIVNYAMFRDENHTNSNDTIYTNIIDNNHILIDFRNANHYTNPSNLVRTLPNGRKVPKTDADYHLSLNSNNTDKQQRDNERLLNEKRQAGDSSITLKKIAKRNGTRFKSSPKLNRAEIVLNVKQFYSNPTLVKQLLFVLLRIVARNSFNPEYIDKLVNDNINQYVNGDDAAKVKIVDIRDKTSMAHQIDNPWMHTDGTLKTSPLTDAVNQQPSTNLRERVMDSYQKSYTAFMENVCKQFNCQDAFPALAEGFNAFCECTD